MVQPRFTALLALACCAGNVRGRRQFAEIGKVHLPPHNERMSALALGDADGDGDSISS
jgi:hypothetical protein